MARKGQKDLLGRLADAGEEAISRLTEIPGGQKALDAVHALRDRIDELQGRVRNLDPLERKVAELEKRLAALEGKKPSPTGAKGAKGAKATPARRTPAKPAATRRPAPKKSSP